MVREYIEVAMGAVVEVDVHLRATKRELEGKSVGSRYRNEESLPVRFILSRSPGKHKLMLKSIYISSTIHVSQRHKTRHYVNIQSNQDQETFSKEMNFHQQIREQPIEYPTCGRFSDLCRLLANLLEMRTMIRA